ncbi:MAG: phosphotransferase [Caulobacterales bacterium]
MQNIPLLRFEDVTPEWLTPALRNTWPDVTVKAVRRGPIFGYKQNKFRVEVDYADAKSELPRTFIVKSNFPGENNPSTGSAWAMANELRSLRDLVPMVTAPHMPKWHHITVTDEASDIVMEDLKPHGVTFFNAFHSLDLGQAMAFMDAFARMHASAWNSPQFKPGGAMGPGTFAGENRRLVNDVYFPTFFTPENWKSYVELPRGRALPNAFQDMERAQKAWGRMWSAISQSAMVMVHGDEHLGNLYVTAEGEPGVLDWVARPEHWPIGIAYFMLGALDIIDRKHWEKALLSHYLTRLKAYGVQETPDFEEAWFLYRCCAFYPVVTWLNNSGIWQPEAVNTVNAVRAAAAAVDHDTFGLLGV